MTEVLRWKSSAIRALPCLIAQVVSWYLNSPLFKISLFKPNKPLSLSNTSCSHSSMASCAADFPVDSSTSFFLRKNLPSTLSKASKLPECECILRSIDIWKWMEMPTLCHQTRIHCLKLTKMPLKNRPFAPKGKENVSQPSFFRRKLLVLGSAVFLEVTETQTHGKIRFE